MGRRLDQDEAWLYLVVGRRLGQARRRAGLTQAMVAERVGLSRAAIANIEAGHQGLTLARFLDFADAVGEDWQTLLTNQPPPPEA